ALARQQEGLQLRPVLIAGARAVIPVRPSRLTKRKISKILDLPLERGLKLADSRLPVRLVLRVERAKKSLEGRTSLIGRGFEIQPGSLLLPDVADPCLDLTRHGRGQRRRVSFA